MSVRDSFATNGRGPMAVAIAELRPARFELTTDLSAASGGWTAWLRAAANRMKLRGMFWPGGTGTLASATAVKPGRQSEKLYPAAKRRRLPFSSLPDAPAAGFSSRGRLTQRTLSAGSWFLQRKSVNRYSPAQPCTSYHILEAAVVF